MRPPQRIELINRCASQLANRTWQDIDFILQQFGLPITDDFNTAQPRAEFHYVRQMLGRSYNEDVQLLELDDYLGGSAVDPDDAQWESDRFRLFLSHVYAEREYASELKARLAWWGIDSFIAHEDIEPGREWVDRIIHALHSCDALAALLQHGFRESKWCEQEVGIALGRGSVPVVPIRIDFVPYGFFGVFQAVPGVGRESADVAKDVVAILMRDKRTGARMTEAIVDMLVQAWAFEHANALAAMLANHPQAVDADDLRRLRAAQEENRQVRDAWNVEDSLTRIEEHLGVSRAASQPVYTYDEFGEEPF